MDNNSSTSLNEKAEVKGEPSRSEEEALLKEIKSIDIAIQSLHNAKREITRGNERRAIYEIREAMQSLHKFRNDRISKSSEYMVVDPVQSIKTFVAESNKLTNKAQGFFNVKNYVQAINTFEEASIKIEEAMALRYCDIGKSECLDFRYTMLTERIFQCKRSLLSNVKRQRLRQRVIFDGLTYYGKPKREYFDRLLRGDTMKSTLFLNLSYDFVAKWKHELEYLTKTNNEAVSTRKSMIVSIENINLFNSNEIQNDSFIKTEFSIKMGCSECDSNKIILRGTMHSPPILISALRRRISKELLIPSSNEHVHWAIFKIDLKHLTNASAEKDQTKSISIYI